MEDRLKPLRAVKKVKSNIEKFETLCMNDDRQKAEEDEYQKRNAVVDSSKISQNSPRSLKQTPKNQNMALQEAFPVVSFSQREEFLSDANPSQKPTVSPHRRHKKQDSTAFLQQVYLQRVPELNTLPEDAREILRSQPDSEDLKAVLQYLQYGIDGKHDFNIRHASPQAAQIIHVLVTVTIPDQWAHLMNRELPLEEKKIKTNILSCLKSVAGLGALIVQLKTPITMQASTCSENVLLSDTISVLEALLSRPSTISELLDDMLVVEDKATQQRVIWQELTALLAGSKVLNSVATAVNRQDEVKTWLADRAEYNTWLAKNITYAVTRISIDKPITWNMLGQMMKRGLNLGHRELFVSEIYSGLLLGKKALWTPMRMLLQTLPRMEQKIFFDAVLRDLARRYCINTSSEDDDHALLREGDGQVGAVAALIKGIATGNSVLEDHMTRWLGPDHGEYASISLDVRRAVVAILGSHEDKLQHVLETSLERFADKQTILHTSLLHQEAIAKTILLLAGYLYRANPLAVKSLARSSLCLNAVSNRLAASQPRARYLGMIVGVGISRLVDDPNNVMDFDLEVLKGKEAERLLRLIETDDQITSIEELKTKKGSVKLDTGYQRRNLGGKLRAKAPSPAKNTGTSKIIAIEEVEDESEDDLVPYDKPDDDPPDSDEDPTLVNRSKPAPPIYILSLIKSLQSNDKPDVVELALKTAPGLIRRKAGFGTELSENIESLAAALINLQEGISQQETENLRLQSLIACVVAAPEQMGPWLASTYFEGDFSLTQRASILSTVGLGARAIAGAKDDPLLSSGEVSFPSERLPQRLEALYSPVNHLAKQIEQATLQPMALAAADRATGPDVLKIRTFSSRLAVEKKTKQKLQERQVRIPKNLHKLLSEKYYLPLCCRMCLLLSTRLNLCRFTIFEPHIFRLFLQTLGLLLASLGPHAAQLPTVTSETLLLLVNLHKMPALSTDPVVLPAMLQLLLAMLDMNVEAGVAAEERLVTDSGPMITELLAWVDMLVGAAEIPDDDQGGTPWTVLAAGCQVKWQEVATKFQSKLLNLMGT